MPKSDDKGEPVKIVRIGGKEVEVPIIFVLPEEAGEKEIERYEHPKVNIKKEDKAAESEEEPLKELTDGKLEEVEKPPFAVPKKKFLNYSDEEIVEEDGKTTTRKKKKPKLLKGYSDDFKEGGFKQQEAPEEEENTPYFDLLSPEKPKKKKKRKHQNSYSDLLSPKKASWVKWLKQKDAPTGTTPKRQESNIPKVEGGDYGELYPDRYRRTENLGRAYQSHAGQSRQAREQFDDLDREVPNAEKDIIEGNKKLQDPTTLKSWEKWLENKGLGALGEGKLDRKTGKPMKLKPRKITLDDFESEKQIDEKERKHREAKEKR